jgi:hypothetical protein
MLQYLCQAHLVESVVCLDYQAIFSTAGGEVRRLPWYRKRIKPNQNEAREIQPSTPWRKNAIIANGAHLQLGRWRIANARAEASITDQESLLSPAVAAELPLMFTIAFAKLIR